MFAEPQYRKKIVDNLQDPVIKAFWQNEFARYSQKLETEALAAIQNKVGQFVSNPLIRNILGQSRSTINMREIMDTGKIFIANLSKGKMGEDNSALLGAMIITRLQLAAMSRVDIPEEKRRDFFMYVDEFQNFATDSFASILSEARKYRLSLTLAHQYIGQLVTNDGNTKVRDAVFGNVGTIITFRVGAADAEFLEKEFMPEFLQNDLVNLAKANIYIKLMIDGVSSKPFSATTLPPHIQPLQSYKDIIIKNTREHYAVPRKIVEERIASEWNTNSETAINEKLGRRDERPLSQVLRPGGTSGASSAGRAGDAPSRDRYMPPRASSGPSSIAPRATSSPSSQQTSTPAQAPLQQPRTASRPASSSPSPASSSSSPLTSSASTPARRETPTAQPVGTIANGESKRGHQRTAHPYRQRDHGGCRGAAGDSGFFASCHPDDNATRRGAETVRPPESGYRRVAPLDQRVAEETIRREIYVRCCHGRGRNCSCNHHDIADRSEAYPDKHGAARRTRREEASVMRFHILTIFPDMFDSYLDESLFKRAQKNKLVSVRAYDLRAFTKDRHKKVDDRPFGGGPGMVLKVQPVWDAVKKLKSGSFEKRQNARHPFLDPRKNAGRESCPAPRQI